jgi:hypothetical protein
MIATDGLSGPFENIEDPDGFSVNTLESNRIYRILDTYTVHIVQGETYVIQRSKEEVA